MWQLMDRKKYEEMVDSNELGHRFLSVQVTVYFKHWIRRQCGGFSTRQWKVEILLG